jgi:hypothetical protein
MILIAAVLIGLIAGLCRAWIGKRKYQVVDLNYPVLVLVAFIPQYFAFFAPKTRELISDRLVVILLVSSLIILMIFSILNIKKSAFWPIFLGFLLNFLVIVLNGGLMPISMETITKMTSGMDATWMIGQRFDYSKDIILSPEMTKLTFLSDRFTITGFLGLNFAFSFGDLLIAVGVIWLLWILGGKPKENNREIINE